MRRSGEEGGKMLATAMVEACSREAGPKMLSAPETARSRPLGHALMRISGEADCTMLATAMVEACSGEAGTMGFNAPETARSRSFEPALEKILEE
jgi:hypothetical protein